MTRVFVSYNYEDRDLVHGIDALFQSRGGRLPGTPTRVRRTLTGASRHEIEQEIERVLFTCVTTLFVIGRDVHNSPWIDFEAKTAAQHGMPIVLMSLPGIRYGPPAALLNRPILEWNSPEVAAALTRAFQAASRD